MSRRTPWRERIEKKKQVEANRRARELAEASNDRRHRQSMRWAKAGVVIALIGYLPAGSSYILGLGLGAYGILKIRDHVENPTSSPLQHGAIRLAAGGGLFALPIVYEAMQNTVRGGDGPDAIALETTTGYNVKLNLKSNNT